MTPSLWGAIEKALVDSEYFLLMASSEAAASHWVQREVEWWLANRSTSNILILLTEGEIEWNSAANDFDWSRTTALPSNLLGRMVQEPLWVDLRLARTEEKLSLRDSSFRGAILSIASTLLNRPKESLDSEDLRVYKRNRLAAYTAAVVSLLLAVCTTIAAVVANRERLRAQSEARIAMSRQLAVESMSTLDTDPTVSFRLAEAAVRTDPNPQALIALFRTFDRQNCFNAATLAGHGALVSDAAFSPDGRLIVTASYDFSIRVWSASTGRQLKQFGSDEFAHAVFSRDGTRILTVSRRGDREKLVVWDAESGRKERAWDADDGKITSEVEVEFARLTGYDFSTLGEVKQRSPDGRREIEVHNDVVILRVTEEGENNDKICQMIGHQGRILSVRFSPDGTRLVTASTDRTARIWHLPTLQRHADARALQPRASPDVHGRFRLDKNGVTDTARGIQARVKGTSVQLVDAKTDRELRQLRGHTAPIDYVVFSPDGSQLATTCAYGLSAGAFDTTVRVWDVASGQQLRQFLGTTQNTVGFSPDGSTIVVNNALWPATWQEVLRLIHDVHVRGVPRELSPEERQLFGAPKLDR